MSNAACVTYGHFSEPSDTRWEYLVLSFSPLRAPLQARWRNNGLSADFLADFVTTFFPKDQTVPGSERRQTVIRSAVSYAANELLENGMKFHQRDRDFPITLHLELHPDRVILHVTNGSTPDRATSYRQHVQSILAGDPNELFVTQLEANAKAGGNLSSGLGLLTMINDYGATLGWKFFSPPDQPGLCIVTTQVELSL